MIQLLTLLTRCFITLLYINKKNMKNIFASVADPADQLTPLFLHLTYRLLRKNLKYIYASVADPADPADPADLLTQPFLNLIYRLIITNVNVSFLQCWPCWPADPGVSSSHL